MPVTRRDLDRDSSPGTVSDRSIGDETEFESNPVGNAGQAFIRKHLVLDPRVDPHWLRFSSSNEAKRSVELYGLTIGSKHLLMKPSVLFHHRNHQLSPDALSLELRMNKHVRIVDNQVAVRDCIAYPNQLFRDSRCDQGMGVSQCCEKFVRLLGR